jgi:SAM-dependent methyltransferase
MEETFDKIENWQERPALYAPGEPRFWDDPHIARSMLAAHLNDSHDAASRRSAVIDRTVHFWLDSGLIKPGDRLLDLGCGPGLYAERLSRAGVHVTGIDLSENSIRYARERADSQNLSIDYRVMNFFDLKDGQNFDVVMQIYGELNTFSDADRDRLLTIIRRSLKPGGLFICDLSTCRLRQKQQPGRSWSVEPEGFWRPHPHLVLEQTFAWPEQAVWLDQYIIVDRDGAKVYRNWFHDYCLETIRPVLEKQGFVIQQAWNDLAGTPYTPDGDWLALVARRCGDERLRACIHHQLSRSSGYRIMSI